MFKKLLSLVLLNCFLLTTANATVTDGLKTAFDNLSYSLTVEWDQHDQTFAQNEIQKFRFELLSLQAQGLTQEQMGQFLKELMKGKADAEVDAFMLGLKNNSLSKEEAAEKLNHMISLAYSDGAHYLPLWGKIALGVVGVAALVFVSGILMWELSDPQIFGDDTEW